MNIKVIENTSLPQVQDGDVVVVQYFKDGEEVTYLITKCLSGNHLSFLNLNDYRHSTESFEDSHQLMSLIAYSHEYKIYNKENVELILKK